MSGRGCNLESLLCFSIAFELEFESRANDDHILLPQFLGSLNLETQVPIFISSKNNVAQLHPHYTVTL
jgi:hypothetical protein